MTQYEYQLICDSLKAGVPALADKLITALNNLIEAHNRLYKQAEEQKTKETREKAEKK